MNKLPEKIHRWAGTRMPVEYYDSREYRYKPRQSPSRWKRLVWVLVGKYQLTVGEVATVLRWPSNASLQRLQRVADSLPHRRRRGIEVGGPIAAWTPRRVHS
ncbi:MAG: hypothetical protein EPN21_20155 [Methylococcaceae bacterium]|nr:MAG: hypothetical protein EPN21_20155 [Methylococcaceae bacterium]